MKNLFLSVMFLSIILIGCGSKDTQEGSNSGPLTQQELTDLTAKAKSIFGALPAKMPGSENDNAELIALGKKLFFETKLSVNGTQSCNTCHDLNTRAGDFGSPVSPGAIAGKQGTRNSPTVLNAGFQFVQFWDGREKDLKGQAKGPILNPLEMAMPDEKSVVKAIADIPEYADMFTKAYPGVKNPLTFDNIANALAAFERTLISKSRYDFFIAGNQLILNNDEKRGLKLFIETGCITCHVGPLFGGSMFQKMGLINPYENTKDMGRFDVTKLDADKYIFKVAQLRNAALTGPYFHDGAVKTLEEAITKMAWMNLGKKLTEPDVKLIASFIKSLTDNEKEKTMAKK
jgi:cytochrome c peroxidase